MSITHDYIAQELSQARIAELRAEAEAVRLLTLVTRRPRGRPDSKPWWHRLRRTGPTIRPRPA
ncbi:MAG: hypothetical protein ACRD0W_21300 [Acidimicrobiales bacterium]